MEETKVQKTLNKGARDVVISWALKSLGVASGFWGFVAKIAAKYLWKLAVKLGVKIETKIENKKEQKEYENKINDPSANADDIKKAGKDFLQG